MLKLHALFPKDKSKTEKKPTLVLLLIKAKKLATRLVEHCSSLGFGIIVILTAVRIPNTLIRIVKHYRKRALQEANLKIWQKNTKTKHELSNLPHEIQIQIASYLEALDLCRLGQTCKKFESISKENSLWLNLIARDWGQTEGGYKDKYNKAKTNSKRFLEHLCRFHPDFKVKSAGFHYYQQRYMTP
jgi:hypothetical protein